MYQITRAEQETHITWNAEEKIATVYTCDPATIRKLDKLAKECPEAYRCTWTDDQYNARKYTLPARYVRFGKPASEAQKACGRRVAAANAAAHDKASA
ncbi:MAG: hypothetical protein IJ466_05810 [Clostridia bacterium]|nr:hypothetical protein [Clostridia bacterium]